MEELGPLFAHPHDPDRLWILIVLVAAVVIALSLVALVRGQLPAALSSASLLLLPVFGYVLGNLQLLEESKRVTFCGSCHETMAPLVASMRRDGTTLAASHYRRGAVSHREGCYQCHSGYGIWGGFRAKVAGVQHMIHTVTGRYEFPLEHVGPFDIDSCRVCHAQAEPFRAAEVHRDPDVQRALLDRELGCTGACHPAAHPPDALNGEAAWRAGRDSH